MPAYTKQIPKRHCCQCQRPATVEVCNAYNASLGYFCARHGKSYVNEYNRLASKKEKETNAQE